MSEQTIDSQYRQSRRDIIRYPECRTSTAKKAFILNEAAGGKLDTDCFDFPSVTYSP